MMDLVQHLGPSLTCHAWNRDCTEVAVSLNTAEIHVYQVPAGDKAGQWELLHVLRQHDQAVSALDWAPGSGLLLSCSHDRSAYVWRHTGGQWTPEMVILKNDRSATAAQWSPCERKFAVGSAGKTVCVCYFDKGNNWWASRTIRRKHSSAVASVAWHPGSQLLATTSTDFKCRIFCCNIPGVDHEDSHESHQFGDLLLEIDCHGSWAHDVAWSPNGRKLAVATHSSRVLVIEAPFSLPPPHQQALQAHSVERVSLPSLPLACLMFISDSVIVGGGFDGRLIILKQPSPGHWDVDGVSSAKTKKGIAADELSESFSSKLGMFKSKEKKGAHASSDSGLTADTLHVGAIVQLRHMEKMGLVSSCGLDGCIRLWNSSGSAFK